jgi:limonene-1,2-epoxide hydrolase
MTPPHAVVDAAASVVGGALDYQAQPSANLARTLYGGLRMHDPAPDSIRTLLARRDEQATGSEWVSVEMGSCFDRRTAYHFFNNPEGSYAIRTAPRARPRIALRS